MGKKKKKGGKKRKGKGMADQPTKKGKK